MRRIIMRAFWGIDDDSDRILRRKHRVDGNIQYLLNNKYQDEFITYCWGKDNYKMLEDNGVKNIKLVYDLPYQWDLVKYQYRHKAEALRICMEDDGYDEILHCDWDCFLTKSFTNDIWDTLNKKESFQACLYQYRRAKCNFRKDDQRKVPNGGCVYIRDKTIPSQIIKTWEGDWNNNKKSLEPAMAKWLDERNNGWVGVEKYKELYEPECCELKRNGVYGKKDNSFYQHWAGMGKIR